MPDREYIPGSPQEWLARARGNLALAKTPVPAGGFWEDLCFNTQQTAEKAIKAVMLHKGISFRYTHDLEELLATFAQSTGQVPEDIKDAIGLTEYAVETRYPGGREPVTEEEYHDAVQTAERVLLWAESIIGS